MMTVSNTNSGCRGCKKSEVGSEKEILQIVNEQLLLETDLVSDETYHNRIKSCKECSSLLALTCIHCGCYVQFRARLENKHCPHPQGAKW